jgi:hypothetical protein
MIDGAITSAVEGCSMGGNIRPGLGRNDPVGCDEMGQIGAAWDRISLKQARAISALLDGETVLEASLAAGLRSKSTLYRWLRKPYFQAALRQVREERRRPLVELKKLLDDPKTQRHIRVRAAESLREIVREPERVTYFGDHGEKVAKSILAILP